MGDPVSGAHVRARALLELQRSSEALGVLRSVLGIDPHNPETHRLCAVALLELGAYADALREAETSLVVDPYSAWAQRLRSVALSHLGQFATSRAAAWEAVRLAPDEPAAHIGAFWAEMGPGGDSGRAAQAAARALELAPDDVVGHLAVAAVDLSRKRWLRAEEHYRAALTLEPANADALDGLARALRGQGRRVEAVELFAAVGRAAPRQAPTRELVRTANEHVSGGVIPLALLLTAVMVVAVGSIALLILWVPDHLPVLVSSPPLLLLAALALNTPLLALLLWRKRRRQRQLPAVAGAVARAEARRQNREFLDALDAHRPLLAVATLVISVGVCWLALPETISWGTGQPSRLSTSLVVLLVMVPVVSGIKVLRALGRVVRGRPAAAPRPYTAPAPGHSVGGADATRLFVAQMFQGGRPVLAAASLALGLAGLVLGVSELDAPDGYGSEIDGYFFTVFCAVVVVVNVIRLLRWGLRRLRPAPFDGADR